MRMTFTLWLIFSLIACIFTVPFAWETDLAWIEESAAFTFMAVAALMGWYESHSRSLHGLYLKNNPAPGLVRAAVLIGTAWIAFTLFFFGSDRITFIWYFYYLIIGVGCIYLFGMMAMRSLGFDLRTLAYLRRNRGAALIISAFMLSTGLIYGGSVWGESEPESFEAFAGPFEVLPSYEEGGWIIALFFVLGWVILYAVMAIFFARHKDLKQRIIRGHDEKVAEAVAFYCLGCAIPITSAVAGDYHGLADSLTGFSALALPVLAGEIVRPITSTSADESPQSWLYLATGLAAAIFSPIASSLLGFR